MDQFQISEKFLFIDKGYHEKVIPWHVTCDTWHGTHDMWHVTSDMWHMTDGRRWTISQNVSFLALMVWEWRCYEDISTKDDLLTESMSNEGVRRTAPATPGLLKIWHLIFMACLLFTLFHIIFCWNLPYKNFFLLFSFIFFLICLTFSLSLFLFTSF